MFTGIVTATGRVIGLIPAEGGARLSVRASEPLQGLAIGESIATSGVCLTVEQGSDSSQLQFFLSAETLQRTRLGELQAGDLLNMERSLRADDRMGGHLVMGHVDGVGTIRRLQAVGEGWELEVEFPPAIEPYLAVKGSVSVDGISLTVSTLAGNAFGVALIPHTVEATNLHELGAGKKVNLEADMLARYVVRALEVLERRRGAGEDQIQETKGMGITEDFLHRAGFGGGGQ